MGLGGGAAKSSTPSPPVRPGAGADGSTGAAAGSAGKVADKVERRHLENVSVLRVEARSLIAMMLPDGSIDRIHVLCPDPWPKKRHRGNRLLCSDFTTQIHRVLKPGGIFHFSSDDECYCAAVNRVITASGLFTEFPDGIADLGGVRSGFEQRWLDMGKSVLHRAWKKLPLVKCTIGH